jgi:hypothetical protein
VIEDGSYCFRREVVRMRRTKVRPMLSWRAMADLLTPERCSLRQAEAT